MKITVEQLIKKLQDLDPKAEMVFQIAIESGRSLDVSTDGYPLVDDEDEICNMKFDLTPEVDDDDQPTGKILFGLEGECTSNQ